MDLFGPTTYRSIGGNCYCLVVVDDYSRYTSVFFLHDKADTYDKFKKFLTRAENELTSPRRLISASATKNTSKNSKERSSIEVTLQMND